ncbi:MAG: low-specificity L-threonine aldolase [Bacteroidota bacterium]
MTIDLRSDTVTKPSKDMLDAMHQAPVGDDVFQEDPSINALESFSATMFGKEKALFCPSGTMTNQIAIRCHTHPGDEVICDELSHVYQYEGGGIASNSGASVKLLQGDRGRITASMVEASIHNPDDVHKPISRLVVLENTGNRGGGSCYDFSDILEIGKVARQHRLSFHIDGARLFNALVAKGETALQYGQAFDTISICLSKGLGAPVGSLLLGDDAFIKKARRIRKVFGGGMRQAGSMAAAGLYALLHNIDRLSSDHVHAKAIEAILKEKSFVKEVVPVETNIVIAECMPDFNLSAFISNMKEKGVLFFAISPTRFRMVTHLDIHADMINQLEDSLKQYN